MNKQQLMTLLSNLLSLMEGAANERGHAKPESPSNMYWKGQQEAYHRAIIELMERIL